MTWNPHIFRDFVVLFFQFPASFMYSDLFGSDDFTCICSFQASWVGCLNSESTIDNPSGLIKIDSTVFQAC